MYVPLIYSVTLNTMLKCVGCALTIQLSNTDYSAYLLDHKIKTIDEKRKKKENDPRYNVHDLFRATVCLFSFSMAISMVS